MFKTKNGLSEATHVKAVELLIARLADYIDLQTQTKHAHWLDDTAISKLLDELNLCQSAQCLTTGGRIVLLRMLPAKRTLQIELLADEEG
jgi:hypothetical protein